MIPFRSRTAYARAAPFLRAVAEHPLQASATGSSKPNVTTQARTRTKRHYFKLKMQGNFLKTGIGVWPEYFNIPAEYTNRNICQKGGFGKHLLILALSAMRLDMWPRITRNLRCWEHIFYMHVQLLSGFWKSLLDRISTAMHIGWKRSAHTYSLEWKFCHPYLEKRWNT